MPQEGSPVFFCPFPSRISPHAEEVRQKSARWVIEHRLVASDEKSHERLQKMGFGLLAARAYPMAPLEALELTADWVSWLFLFDDCCDEMAPGRSPDGLHELQKHLHAAVHREKLTPEAPPIALALRDVLQRIEERGLEETSSRFRRNVIDYLAANRWEAHNRSRNIVPRLSDYCAMRPLTGAVYSCFELLDITDGIRLPPEVRAHPDLKLLERSANSIICWCNDVLSVEKEMRHGDVHNLVLAIQHELNCALPEAIDRAVKIHNTEVHAFVELAARRARFDSVTEAHLERYIAGLSSWIRANLDWSLTAVRYQTPVGSESKRICDPRPGPLPPSP